MDACVINHLVLKKRWENNQMFIYEKELGFYDEAEYLSEVILVESETEKDKYKVLVGVKKRKDRLTLVNNFKVERLFKLPTAIALLKKKCPKTLFKLTVELNRND